MILGYYYHIPVSSKNDRLFVPGYAGIFLDSLATKVEKLYLFMHDANEQQSAEADYELRQKNISFISLGLSSPAWYRHLFHKKILDRIAPVATTCNVIIIRSPTPLAPFFKFYKGSATLFFMVVGDYLEGARQFKIKNLRDWIMIQYLKRNDYLFKKAMRITNVLVNSPGLFKKYQSLSKSIHLIGTATLTQHDFFEREDTCKNKVTELLYTGRIEAAKGLFELVEAVAKLKDLNIETRLNIAGWEAGNKKKVETELLAMAAELKITSRIIFHGKKNTGAQLNEMYRNADIYVIPSYHEGFPRTIWEAMANSLPVIATRVGGIPDYLAENENALFIEPKNVDDLVNKIMILKNDKNLRTRLIKNGYALAKNNTMEIQTNNLVDIIEKQLRA